MAIAELVLYAQYYCLFAFFCRWWHWRIRKWRVWPLVVVTLRPCVPQRVGVSTRGVTGTMGSWDEAEMKEAKYRKKSKHFRIKVLWSCSVVHSSPWLSPTKAMFTHGEKDLTHSLCFTSCVIIYSNTCTNLYINVSTFVYMQGQGWLFSTRTRWWLSPADTQEGTWGTGHQESGGYGLWLPPLSSLYWGWEGLCLGGQWWGTDWKWLYLCVPSRTCKSELLTVYDRLVVYLWPSTTTDCIFLATLVTDLLGIYIKLHHSYFLRWLILLLSACICSSLRNFHCPVQNNSPHGWWAWFETRCLIFKWLHDPWCVYTRSGLHLDPACILS